MLTSKLHIIVLCAALSLVVAGTSSAQYAQAEIKIQPVLVLQHDGYVIGQDTSVAVAASAGESGARLLIAFSRRYWAHEIGVADAVVRRTLKAGQAFADVIALPAGLDGRSLSVQAKVFHADGQVSESQVMSLILSAGPTLDRPPSPTGAFRSPAPQLPYPGSDDLSRAGRGRTTDSALGTNRGARRNPGFSTNGRQQIDPNLPRLSGTGTSSQSLTAGTGQDGNFERAPRRRNGAKGSIRRRLSVGPAERQPIDPNLPRLSGAGTSSQSLTAGTGQDGKFEPAPRRRNGFKGSTRGGPSVGPAGRQPIDPILPRLSPVPASSQN